MTNAIFVSGQMVLGFVLLVGGGELLVRGAAALASALKISPLVIGLTVVAFGTSAPELGVSLQAAVEGKVDVAIGNVVGSNITNILLILGVSALVTPLIVSSQLIRIDVPLMICASLCLWGVASDGFIQPWEGAAMFGLLVVYVVFCIRKSRSESQEVIREFDAEYGQEISGFRDIAKQLGYVIVGLVLLGFGSKVLVDGAVEIATWLGVSELVIGLTVIAIGTSLPEAVTSIVASYRGQRDIAVGNVVGSNLFNILCVLGLTAIVSPQPLSVSTDALDFHIPVMVAVSMICMPIFLTNTVIRRWEGGLFLLYFIAYTVFIVLTATGYTTLTLYHPVIYAIVALTLLALIVSFYQGVAPTNDSAS